MYYHALEGTNHEEAREACMRLVRVLGKPLRFRYLTGEWQRLRGFLCACLGVMRQTDSHLNGADGNAFGRTV